MRVLDRPTEDYASEAHDPASDESAVGLSRGVHYLVRRASAVLAKRRSDAQARRLDICRDILAGDLSSLDGTELAPHYKAASRKDQHYLVGALYVLLMPERRRQRLAAYFTPPGLSEYVVSRLLELGFDPSIHSALDPACGGAAFLVPIAEKMLALAHDADKEQVARSARSRLTGIEIEPGLASLSELLIADALGTTRTTSSAVVLRANALRSTLLGDKKFDVVVSNPPYGRVFRPNPDLLDTWRDVITDGHVNTYSLFIALSLHLARPGGLIALLIPTSFTGGPYFSRLRGKIRQLADVIRLDLIEKRSDEFLDVTQDTCVLFLRRKREDATTHLAAPSCALIRPTGVIDELGDIHLPEKQDGEWILPGVRDGDSLKDVFRRPITFTLQDYGYEARSGYFVWNRSLADLENRDSPLRGELPLIWAQNIEADRSIEPISRPIAGKLAGAVTFVRVPSTSTAIVYHPCVVLQRTTNRRQPRRLVAGFVEQTLVDRYGGLVTENHTIVLVPKTLFAPLVTPEQLAALLNSAPVDDLYRRISGTVSVSTKLLRKLPLPKPSVFLEQLAISEGIDAAVMAAYSAS